MHEFSRGKRAVFSRKIITVLFTVFFFLCLFSGYQNAFANGIPALVETQWLAENLKKPEISLVYVAGMVQDDKANFDKKHIAGSVYLDIGSLMGTLGDGSAAPDKAKFESLMGNLGISNDTHVVIYGVSGGNPFITTAFWLMKYNGHKNVSYLNGGVTKWASENRTTTGEPAKITPAKYKAMPDESIRADAAYVLQNLKNPKVAIIDARGVEEYKGTDTTMGNKRTGHIPSAIHLESRPTNLNNDGTFKSAETLRSAYEAKGVTKDKEIIVYCQGGVRASHTHFVLKYILGYPKVRNYVGSWGEWGNRLDPAKYPAEK